MWFILLIAIVVIASTVGKKYWMWIVGIPIVLIVVGMFQNHPVVLLILAAAAGYWIYSNSEYFRNKRIERQFIDWKNQALVSQYDDNQVLERMEKLGQSLPFYGDEVPFGRAEYFATSFENLFFAGDMVYGYYPVRSAIDSELREYGIVVTNRGIGLATQTVLKDKNSREERSVANVTELLFSGMWFINYDEEKQIITIRTELQEMQIDVSDYPLLNYGLLVANVNWLITSGFTHDLYTGVTDERFEQALNDGLADLTDASADVNQRRALFDEASQDAGVKLNARSNADAIEAGMNTQVGATAARNLHNIQINQMVNGRQGHGVAAEYTNSVFDGGFLTNSGLRGQDNAKHGADRLSFGRKVQVKTSIKLGSENSADSIKLSFKDGKTQRMGKYQYENMPTEVPKDQYQKSLEYMREQIRKGNVEGHTNPNDASKLVKRGKFSTNFYRNATKAGTLESLTVDSVNAVEQSLPKVGIVFIMSYASARWQGAEKKDAAKIAGGVSLSAGIMSTGTILFTTQVAKSNMGKKIFESGVAKKLGLKQGAKDIGKYAGRTLTVVVTFGPMVVDALRGRISTEQLFKGSVIAGVSLAVGSLSGPAGLLTVPIASYFTKKVLDVFVEDDAKEMYQVFKEEFLDVVMASELTHEEFQEVLEMTFQNKKLGGWLKDMFAANDSRSFARDVLVNEAVLSVLKKRKKITNEEILTAYSAAEDEYVVA